MEWYLKVVRDNYANFKGRATRQEYWMFALFNFIFIIVVSVIDVVTGLGFIYPLYALALFIPSIAAGIRRMHDVGKSGWFLLIPIYNLILAVSSSDPNTNHYSAPD